MQTPSMRARSLVAAGLVALLAQPVIAAPRPLSRGELRWLERVTAGIDSAAVERYRRLGRDKFLDEQLKAPLADAGELASAVAAIPVSHESAESLLRAARAEQRRIAGLAPAEQQQARAALRERGRQVVYQAAKRRLVRALVSPWQLREQMTWFWLNHFSVFAEKGNVRWTVAEYEDAVRSRALGRFADLVMATVSSPAMLEYLDNARSAKGAINENYARELMELHTLGVSGGPSGSSYTQRDVQELARILTGVGIAAAGRAPRLSPEEQRLYVRRGLFEFNPARHDFGDKVLLGHRIAGRGFDEVEEAVALLCRQPATARFVSRRLAQYFVADQPPPALVDKMARAFERSDGSIAAVLRAMFLDKGFVRALGEPGPAVDKLKDPMQFVVSTLRLAYEGRRLSNYRPVVGWLQQLGEPLYGRVTPDGYPLDDAAWASPGQMVRRFEIARAIGSGNAKLFDSEDDTPSPATGFPLLSSRLYYDAIEASLGAQTRQGLSLASSQQEWNMLVLSSPEWMQR